MDELQLKEKLSVLILSYDGFSELWAPFFNAFFETWPDCPFDVYLMTNEKVFDHPRVTSLLLGPDISWSDNLIKALNIISTEYVLPLYEDAFFTGMKKEKVMRAISYCLDKQLDSLLLMPSKMQGKKKINEFVYRISKDALYRNSLFVNIINRKVLLQLLRPGENAWQYEVIGNDRSKKFDFYCVNQPLFRYDHGIIKGKWLAGTKKKLELKGYRFSRLCKTIPATKEWMYKLKLTVFNAYLSALPLRLLLLIEKKRFSNKSKYL